VSRNGVEKQVILGKRLNILGALASDNSAKRRTDVSIEAGTMPAVTLTTSQAPGTWFPADDALSTAGLVRISSANDGVTLIGLASSDDPVRSVRFVTNIGSATITVATAGNASQQIRTTSFDLRPNATARVTWDSVDRVYRVFGAPESPLGYVIHSTLRVGVAGEDILNPNE
jgi:hypothetical protein